MNSPVNSQTGCDLSGLSASLYIGYQVYNANYVSVKTEIATYVSADDPGTSEVVQATGTAIRKESIIQQQTNGVITYVVNDGGKVSKGGRLPRFMQRSRMLRHSSRLKP